MALLTIKRARQAGKQLATSPSSTLLGAPMLGQQDFATYQAHYRQDGRYMVQWRCPRSIQTYPAGGETMQQNALGRQAVESTACCKTGSVHSADIRGARNKRGNNGDAEQKVSLPTKPQRC